MVNRFESHAAQSGLPVANAFGSEYLAAVIIRLTYVDMREKLPAHQEPEIDCAGLM